MFFKDNQDAFIQTFFGIDCS